MRSLTGDATIPHMLRRPPLSPANARRLLASAALLGSLACGDSASPLMSDDDNVIAAALTIDPSAFPSYATALPAFYTPTVLAREAVNPAGTPFTDAGVTLGRVLFWDTRLSVNSTVSCATCHMPARAFGDTARFSAGFEGVGRTAMHSMRLVNARFNESGRYFWDRRAVTLEAQTTEPIKDPVEMGFDASHGGFGALTARLDTIPLYPALFRRVFGDDDITEPRIRQALAQYLRSLVSVSSRFDLAYAAVFDANLPGGGTNPGVPFPAFTAEENLGKQLFLAPPPQGMGCAGCHVPPTFSLSAGSRSNGLDASETRIFRSPSLKNVARTSRFMHDGRFTTLEQVVAFYDHEVVASPSLDARLQSSPGVARVHNRSASDLAALVAFLRTLTDDVMLANPKFGDPFRR